MSFTRQISRSTVRRIAIHRQHLTPHTADLDEVVRALGCVQLDPIRAVERTQWLVLWSRLGNFDRTQFEQHMWQKNNFFEYWAHAASIVLTEDYPLHSWYMKKWHTPKGSSTWAQRQREMIQKHADLRQHILDRIRDEGPLPSRAFDDKRVGNVSFSGWTSPRLISRMFDHLWSSGQLLVSSREGNQRIWDLADRVLPDWTPREEYTDEQITFHAAQIAIRALGIATASQIKKHYTRHRYPNLTKTLKSLESTNTIQRVEVIDDAGNPLWKQPAYIHTLDLPVLDDIESGTWQPRTTLLSPFDNLICDRDRTAQLWDFDFTIEIYVPKKKRKYGYYVLPILHGEHLMGRIDPQMDRKTNTLHINAIHTENNSPTTAETVEQIRSSIQSLADFLGATKIKYTKKIPTEWKGLTS